MKFLMKLLVLGLILTGCSTQPVFETLGEIPVEGTIGQPQQIIAQLPEDMLSPVMESSDQGKLYICDDFSLTLQTLSGGDLNGTLQYCTGFSKDSLTVITTEQGDLLRHECVWTAAGEGESQTCRLAILDDGNYHYVMTVMASSEIAGELQQKWQTIFDSFRLEFTDSHTDA